VTGDEIIMRGMAMLTGRVVVLLSLIAAPLSAQQTPDSSAVAAGKVIYEGRGLCFSCHGLKGEGMLGPTTRLDSTKTWLHHDGTVAGIAALVKSGVDGNTSKSGQEMPPAGGARLTDQQLSQVAAYVWTLHRGKRAS
jgi:mono/diheme cytochrome c family protein